MKPKIVTFDIENTPGEGEFWGGTYQTNILNVLRHPHLLSYAWRVRGEKKVHVNALPDYTGYAKNPRDDFGLTKDLWNLFNDHDILIGHNLDKFDCRKANARFLYWGLKPPSPYKTVDTLKVFKKYFSCPSNHLDDIAQFLGVPGKIETGGKSLWWECQNKNPKAWKLMKKYNKQDVVITDAVYDELLPWIENHPNLAHYIDDNNPTCPNCQGTTFQKRGSSFTLRGEFQRYQCQTCGAWKRGSENIMNTDKRKAILTSAK